MNGENLFTDMENEQKLKVAPLAVRMRPRTLDEVAGQSEAVGEGSWLRMAIEADTLSSVILFGPAGTGKTSIAHVIAETTKATFVEVSAIGGTVSDLRQEINEAEKRLLAGIRTILFVDEIHRFNRSQQDALLHAVEDRIIVLIGATTENPFFEVNSALISRSRIVKLQSLADKDIAGILRRALEDRRGLAGEYELSEDAEQAIVVMSGGDARAALTTLELSCEIAQSTKGKAYPKGEKGEISPKGKKSGRNKTFAPSPGVEKIKEAEDKGGDREAHGPKPMHITLEMVQRATPNRVVPYDKNRDMHYDIISAFIKSMRGSDPDAALYWLARMIEGGEDPKFIARRIFILAAEDIGNADPQALLIAEAAFKSAEVIGYPECQLILAQAATYMALAPKSNASCGIFEAMSEVKNGPTRFVPDNLRDRHRPGSENYGKYKYPHSYPGGWVDQQYLPDGLEKGCFYHPSERGWEAYRTDAIARDRADCET